ncbi:MAG: HAD-IC family P-type ATPase [Firmicutes bacterium]|nr:HAD-IC family P-type ATPase [Bacillota bacterium]
MDRETKEKIRKGREQKAQLQAQILENIESVPIPPVAKDALWYEKNTGEKEEIALKRTAQRLKKLPKVTTKDTNISNDAIHFDEEIFEEREEEKSFEKDIFSNSRTIDGSLLPKFMMRLGRKKKKKGISIDFTNAERFEASESMGLNEMQVEQRQREGFVNVNKAKHGKSYGSIFFSNIFTFFNLMVFAVAAALIVFANHDDFEFTQLVFLIIILANITVGIVTEIKSKMTVEKLKLVTAPTAIAIRNGERVVIPVGEVVLDDILVLEMGKQIPSDGEVIGGEVEVNEALLTGESETVKKIAKSELYSGSFVTSGSCYMRVTKVGAANYVETLSSHAKRYKKPKSQLMHSVRFLIRIISIFIVPITVIMIWINAVNMGTTWEAWGRNIFQVSGAVIGMLPAGMFLLTSIALSVSVIRLSKKKTTVQDLYCIEMLARVDTLCLDKTGTITDGTMNVKKVIDIKGSEKLDYSAAEIIGSMLTATGDNNQTAMALANYFGYSKTLRPENVLPFSSQRKMTAVSFEGKGTFMFGAPEFVLKDMGVRIEKIVGEAASDGHRVLVLAHSPANISGDKLPSIRRPLYVIVIEDHIRDTAYDTIKWFKENDVEIKVISGDNPITVSEVAKRVGVPRAELYISCHGLSQQEVLEAAKKYTVFGRVSPEQKEVIVRSLKAQGRTVAMTGDGVNDILAMREADCSVALASGADAARNVAHLVLRDSSFASMPDVVKEGRRVVNNIQKASSLFLMKTLMAILLSIIFLIVPTILDGNVVADYLREYPFRTNQMLLLEFFIIGIPSFVLALQPNHNLIKGNFLSNVIGRSVPGGITIVFAVMVTFVFFSLGGAGDIYFPYYEVPMRFIENPQYMNAYELSIAQQAMHPYALIAASNALYSTMMVLAMTFAGFMMLVKVCEPFDIWRSILIVGCGLLILFGASVLPTMFGVNTEHFALNHFFFLMAVVLGSYFVASFLVRVMKGLKILNY